VSIRPAGTAILAQVVYFFNSLYRRTASRCRFTVTASNLAISSQSFMPNAEAVPINQLVIAQLGAIFCTTRLQTNAQIKRRNLYKRNGGNGVWEFRTRFVRPIDSGGEADGWVNNGHYDFRAR
jgi:hypothetical protein